MTLAMVVFPFKTNRNASIAPHHLKIARRTQLPGHPRRIAIVGLILLSTAPDQPRD